MKKTFRDYKPGPVKTIVEREIREFVNELEERLPVSTVFNAGVSTYYVEGGIMRDNVLDIVDELMEQRGIKPKGSK